MTASWGRGSILSQTIPLLPARYRAKSFWNPLKCSSFSALVIGGDVRTSLSSSWVNVAWASRFVVSLNSVEELIFRPTRLAGLIVMLLFMLLFNYKEIWYTIDPKFVKVNKKCKGKKLFTYHFRMWHTAVLHRHVQIIFAIKKKFLY